MRTSPVAALEAAAPNWLEDVDGRLCLGIRCGWERGVIEGGDTVVLVTGWRRGSGHTNTVRVYTLPDADEPPTHLFDYSD